MKLDQPVEFLKGVGPTRAKLLLEAFGVRTAADLLLKIPYRYIDKTQVTAINQVRPDDNWICLRATLKYSEIVGHKKKRLVAHVSDGSGLMELVWFQGIQWIKNYLHLDHEYLIYGKINSFNRVINMAHPELEAIDPAQKGYDRLMPIYYTTDRLTRSGLDVKVRRTLISNILRELEEDEKKEFIPEQLLEKHNFLPWYTSMVKVHFPRTLAESEQAKRRFVYEEFFINQSRLILQKLYRKQNIRGYSFPVLGDFFDRFYAEYLPFELTGAQKKVIKEIRKDLSSGFQLNRLIQGDVGSGKTVVALIIALIAAGNNYQSAIMAPLEILAQQHYASIKKMVGDLGFNIALLTGSTKKKERTQILEQLASGEIHLLIGTHAVAEPPVIFKQLGVVIIDEQHRFGVEQRAALWAKASPLAPHVIVMTATPIPRTLAMSVYGDLDVSVIDELPPGRKPIVTQHVTEFRRPEMHQFVRNEIDKGLQIFCVFPLIEESEKLDLENLQMGFDRLRATFPAPQYHLSVVHGKMKSAEKRMEMDRFIRGETHILISTTVIEVGVDIPNASVMVIENADRFGLSQLHQLRGRVGRGADQSYCILMSGFKLSADAKKRIETMVSTNDGFKIAEVDMELRGPGSMEGTKQSGKIDFNLANLNIHQDIFKIANKDALQVVEQDPRLSAPEHLELRKYLNKIFSNTKDWSNIG